MNIKLITKITVLFCLFSVVIVPVFALIFNIITIKELETLGRFALSTTGPLGVLIGGLAFKSVRNGSAPPA
tara:strand:- start:339 stop:551 length:213 start_codon:yes stop_codon:yes gene_type:complete